MKNSPTAPPHASHQAPPHASHQAPPAPTSSAAQKKLERKPAEDIDASAEAFIKKFRQQLLLQRLESIENYEKMLARGL
ncbi:pathogen-associated molecular patterns-induced protein A70 [Punica granatum]|uniref:Uncharacterized protein n=2 Tax=Punica granatum TaxID=22663 RepID=A0A218X0F1_PUNGR|nr:pathogen-associated molecular patterns-induced protein A70 [Punica granatum]OWM78256.1 hypothetical protein CDL15_Pgr015075 [Punica granatum]PKI40871.1 hypothetical protein CRG98_038712 [Punica granatum]